MLHLEGTLVSKFDCGQKAFKNFMYSALIVKFNEFPLDR